VGRVWRRGRKGVGLGIRLQRQRHSDTDSIPLGGFNPGAYLISAIWNKSTDVKGAARPFWQGGGKCKAGREGGGDAYLQIKTAPVGGVKRTCGVVLGLRTCACPSGLRIRAMSDAT